MWHIIFYFLFKSSLLQFSYTLLNKWWYWEYKKKKKLSGFMHVISLKTRREGFCTLSIKSLVMERSRKSWWSHWTRGCTSDTTVWVPVLSLSHVRCMTEVILSCPYCLLTIFREAAGLDCWVVAGGAASSEESSWSPTWGSAQYIKC